MMKFGTLTISCRGCLWVIIIVCVIKLRECRPQHPNDSHSRSGKNERTVVFPVSNETGPVLPVFPDTPPLVPIADEYGRPLCARRNKDTFCEEVENYPLIEIRKAINYSSEEFVELFGTMVISSRKSGDLDEDPVCPQHAKLFYPKAAVNENDQWAFVVNDVDYVQTVMAEVCDGEDDQPCHYLDGTLPADVTSRCRQKYAYKRLLALHPNKRKTYTDAFRFPSCCVCYVKKPYLLSRVGRVDVEDQTPVQRPKPRRRGRPPNSRD